MNLTLSALLTSASGDGAGAAQGLAPGAGGDRQAAGPGGLFSFLLSGHLQLDQAAAGILPGNTAPVGGLAASGQPLPLAGKLLPQELAGRLDELPPELSQALAEGRLPDDLVQWLEQVLAAAQGERVAPLPSGGQPPQMAGAMPLQPLAMPQSTRAQSREDAPDALLRLIQDAAPGKPLERALAEALRPAQPAAGAGEGKDTSASFATALAGAGAEAPQRTAAEAQGRPTATPQLPVDQPVGQRGWDQALANRVVWMTNEQLQNAQLKLNPPHLGPLEVRVSVHQDQTANVSFVSQNAGVREAVEAAIPRLREMLAESGVNLADVNVSDQPRSQARDGQNGGQTPGEDAGASLAAADTDRENRPGPGTEGVGLVDYFA